MHCRDYLLAACLASALALAVPALAAAKSSATRSGDAAARCVRLDNRLAQLRLKLRMGYSARQGRLYRQQVESLEKERRALCQ